MQEVVIITGCSSGFGQATARHFAEAGWHVWATMRNVAAGAPLVEEAARRSWRLDVLPLDVTQDDSVQAAVAAVLAGAGRIDALVNNAGYFCFGPVEETQPDELRAQLETNLVGVLRVTRAVLPVMRRQGRGRIVNVSSLAAVAVVPMLGPYHASKAALEALGEALHYEVAPFGVRVSSVLPGPFPTQLHKNQVRVAASYRPQSPYAAAVQHFEQINGRAPRGDPEVVVRAIFKACTSRRPRLRYMVGPLSLLARFGNPLTPQWLYGFLVRKVFRLDRLRLQPPG